jgi:hypothetical protein
VTGERRSHEQKTSRERQNYFDTTIRNKPTPTIIEQIGEIDSTDSTVVESTAEPTFRRTRKRNPPSRFKGLRDNWLKVAAGVVLAIAGWTLKRVDGLNREVGELHVKVDDDADAQKQLKADFAHFEDETREDMIRIIDRLTPQHR